MGFSPICCLHRGISGSRNSYGNGSDRNNSRCVTALTTAVMSCHVMSCHSISCISENNSNKTAAGIRTATAVAAAVAVAVTAAAEMV
jgi:branched-subunit amino acid transport protein AzlD